MRITSRGVLIFFALCFSASIASALTVTLELNGFVSQGGSITGEGLDDPVAIPPTQQQIKLDNLQPGVTYRIDFFHNSGDDGSDFEFVINKAGTGIESVTLGGDRHTMVTDFKTGDTTLKLNTHKITFNPDKTQSGGFAIRGMTADDQPKNSPPVVAKLIPGRYVVDNFGGPPGANEYEFMVDAKGKATPIGRADEYATFVGSTITPRVAKVHFKLVANGPIQYTGSHDITNVTTAPNHVTEFDMAVPVGGGGVTITTFGPAKIIAGNVIQHDGKALMGTESDNDVVFNPRVCYDSRRGFFFETVRGPTFAVSAEAEGKMDDKATPLTVKMTASIYVPPKPTTRPATSPPAPPTTRPR